jgi:hypothetical protein
MFILAVKATQWKVSNMQIHTLTHTNSHTCSHFQYKQFTGSFKERGARNALLNLPQEQKKIGVIAASAGEHVCMYEKMPCACIYEILV